MLKVKSIRLHKMVKPADSGIITETFDGTLYDIFEDLSNQRYILFKKEGPGSDRTFGIWAGNVAITEYFERTDVLPAKPDDEQEVRRGPGRPPKQHVLA